MSAGTPSIAPGARLGPYQIVASLGAGGMGEVFRATDSRLGREVALKLLPDSMAADPERMARFEREARVLASLNHPNIAGLHGIEESDGRKALVMELVEGEDLSTRIARGPMPVDEALPIAIQIARALEAAHLKGITHRDLKPANVRLTPDGTVKVLDFGLAKPAAPDGSSVVDARISQSPTFTHHATQVGMVLGTAAYMSPEQARGRAVDARSDVFSFGCILFEMVSGAHAFAGEDISEILASVIKGDVQWSLMPAGVPEALRRIIRHCLEGRVDERYQAIGDVRIDLARLVADPALLAPVPAGAPAAGGRGPSWRLAAGIAFGALVLGGAIAFALRPAAPRGTLAANPVRFVVEGQPADFAMISPDARWLAWEEDGGLRLRRLDELEPRTRALPWRPRVVGFAGDSRSVLLQRTGEKNGELWSLPVDGGEPRLICRLPEVGFLWGRVAPAGAALLFGMDEGGIHSVPVSGGVPVPILPAGEGESYGSPRPLPGSDAFLFCETDSGRILLREGGRTRVLLELPGERMFDPIYVPSGHLLVRMTGGASQAGNWAVPFSLRERKVTGAPFLAFPYGMLSAADDGTLALRPIVANAPPRRLVWVDRGGAVVGAIGGPVAGLRAPRLSPDGRRVAVVGYTKEAIERNRHADLFIIDAASGAMNVLRDDRGREATPTWSEDGATVRFTTWNAGIRILQERAADGSGGPREIHGTTFVVRSNHHGRSPVFIRFGPRRLETTGAKEDDRRLLLLGDVTAAEASPDSRFVAYTADPDPGIFFRRIDAPEGLVASVPGQSDDLTWSWDGREVLYWRGDSLMVVPVATEGETLRPGVPRLLFSVAGRGLLAGPEFDVAPDGRLLMIQDAQDAASPTRDPGIVVVQNWAAGLASTTASRTQESTP